MDKIKTFNQKSLKTNLPALRAGMKARVWQKIKEGDKERLQAFEGTIIATKHGKGKTAAFTIRKISGGIGVERVFPLHAPTIEKIEVLSQAKVRRAKLFYLRGRVGKKSKMKQVELAEVVAPAPTKEKEMAPAAEEVPAA